MPLKWLSICTRNVIITFCHTHTHNTRRQITINGKTSFIQQFGRFFLFLLFVFLQNNCFATLFSFIILVFFFHFFSFSLSRFRYFTIFACFWTIVWMKFTGFCFVFDHATSWCMSYDSKMNLCFYFFFFACVLNHK